jgi:hypothetical protein
MEMKMRVGRPESHILGMTRIEYAAELKAAIPGVVSSSTAPLSDMSAITRAAERRIFSSSWSRKLSSERKDF